MTKTKRKVSVSLDAELLDELDAGDGALSNQVNDALRNELMRRRRQRMLAELLNELEVQNGKPNEALVADYMDLLR